MKGVALISNRDRHLAELPWYLEHSGYVRRDIYKDGKKIVVRLHREVMGLCPGDETEADHINRVKTDCRRSNLRLATHGQNGQNVTAGKGKSKRRGVYYDTRNGRWYVQVKHEGKKHYGGRFDSLEDATKAARRLRKKILSHATD